MIAKIPKRRDRVGVVKNLHPTFSLLAAQVTTREKLVEQEHNLQTGGGAGVTALVGVREAVRVKRQDLEKSIEKMQERVSTIRGEMDEVTTALVTEKALRRATRSAKRSGKLVERANALLDVPPN
jgi:TolA-binding protein